MFTRAEWMTKSQVQSFFSQLTATCRSQRSGCHQAVGGPGERYMQLMRENSNEQDLVHMVNREINVSHPVCYDIQLRAVASFEKLRGTNASGLVHSKGFGWGRGGHAPPENF